MTRLISIITLVLCIILQSSMLLVAEEKPAADAEGIDAVLLLDASGSMRITDPLRLRHEALRLFTQFLRSSDRLAIVEFSDNTKVLRPLIEYSPQQDTDVARIISSASDNGEYTDINAALQAGWEILKKDRRPNSEQVIILFSDGMMEPNPNHGSAQKLTDSMIEELLPELRAQSVRVYSLAFSEQSDKELLAQVSGITSAVSWYAPTSDKIHEYFAEMFLTVKKPQMQPLTSRGFKIDNDIQEATFYINREPEEVVTLISPAGSRISSESKVDGIKWFKGELFDVITIEAPEAGQWQLTGLAKNMGFATLLTNLKLNTEWPAAITADEPVLLEARLYEFNKPVVLTDLSEKIGYAFQITPTDRISGPVVRSQLHDDGKHGDRIASDGIFSAEVVLNEEGEYKLQVVASAPTFERRQQVSFRVKPPLVRLKVVGAEDSVIYAALPEHERPAKAEYLRVELSPELASAKIENVELLATNQERRLFKIPLTRVDNIYEVATDKLPGEGEYKIRAKLTAEGRRGRKVQAESQPITYVRIVEINKEEAAEVVVVEEKKEEPIKPPSFPWLYLLILLVLNGGLGFAALQVIKKQQVGRASSEIGAVFLDAAVFETKVVELEKVGQQTEVNLDDPALYSDESLDSEDAKEEAAIEEVPVTPTEEPESASETESDEQSESEEEKTE